MRLVAFSDLHAHPYKGGKVGGDGINSRLRDCVDALAQVYGFAQSSKADAILFLGDLFHTRKRVDTSASSLVHRELSRWTIPSYFMVGNHDQYDKGGSLHSLEPLAAKRLTVVKRSYWLVDADRSTAVFMVSFIHDTRELKRVIEEAVNSAPDAEYYVLAGHLGVDGTKVNQGKYAYRVGSDIGLGDLHTKFWDLVLLGHFHTPQKIAKNVHYVGATLQHFWSDEGEERGCMLIDTLTGKIEREPIKAPKFRTFTWGDDLDAEEGDYTRIVFGDNPTTTQLEAVKGSLGDGTAITVKPERKKVKRSSISLANGNEAMLRNYMKLMGKRSRKLFELGKGFIR